MCSCIFSRYAPTRRQKRQLTGQPHRHANWSRSRSLWCSSVRDQMFHSLGRQCCMNMCPFVRMERNKPPDTQRPPGRWGTRTRSVFLPCAVSPRHCTGDARHSVKIGRTEYSSPFSIFGYESPLRYSASSLLSRGGSCLFWALNLPTCVCVMAALTGEDLVGEEKLRFFIALAEEGQAEEGRKCCDQQSHAIIFRRFA